MVRRPNGSEFTEDERALVDAFQGELSGEITAVVSRAEQKRPSSLVREAYWELVSEGVLVPDAGGRVKVKLPA